MSMLESAYKKLTDGKTIYVKHKKYGICFLIIEEKDAVINIGYKRALIELSNHDMRVVPLDELTEPSEEELNAYLL